MAMGTALQWAAPQQGVRLLHEHLARSQLLTPAQRKGCLKKKKIKKEKKGSGGEKGFCFFFFKKKGKKKEKRKKNSSHLKLFLLPSLLKIALP